MKKNWVIRLRLDTETINNLKKEAESEMISFSELCRNKLFVCPKITKIESLLESICERLDTQLNTKKEVKMVTTLPTFKGYTVDSRLKQFRKVDKDKPSIDFVDFDSEEGQELLAEYEEDEESDTDYYL